MMTTKLAGFLALTLGLTVSMSLGCVKSSTTQASSKGSSNTASSPFKSSSSSKDSEDTEDTEDAAYRRDVRDYASSFDASAGDTRVFQRDLSEIAETHGFTDWESREGSYLAIGSGFARANLDDRGFAEIAIELANEDYSRLALLQAGFESQSGGADAK
jgi:hypothetical protein